MDAQNHPILWALFEAALLFSAAVSLVGAGLFLTRWDNRPASNGPLGTWIQRMLKAPAETDPFAQLGIILFVLGPVLALVLLPPFSLIRDWLDR